LKKYLDYIIQNAFLEKMEKNNSVYFVITEKGLSFVQEFRKVKRFSEAFGINI
jgi:predicted transcriptional regulator